MPPLIRLGGPGPPLVARLLAGAAGRVPLPPLLIYMTYRVKNEGAILVIDKYSNCIIVYNFLKPTLF